MGLIVLEVKKDVAGDTEQCDVEIIPTQVFTVHSFAAEGPFSENAVAKLIWKYEHATETEEVLWSIKGGSKMPSVVRRMDGDGVRKLALCMENSALSGTVFMSGKVEVITG